MLSQHALQVVSQHALQGGVLSQHALQLVSQHALQGGVLSQHALQVVSQHALQGGLLPGGSALGGSALGVCSRGCLVPGGGAWSRGGTCSGGCMVETPRTATAVGGTHPTGMHSCYWFIFSLWFSDPLFSFRNPQIVLNIWCHLRACFWRYVKTFMCIIHCLLPQLSNTSIPDIFCCLQLSFHTMSSWILSRRLHNNSDNKDRLLNV